MDQTQEKLIVLTAGDVMTRDIVSVHPESSLEEAIDIFVKRDFSGLPVVNSAGLLVGVVTQYDLVVKGSGLHIPTLVKTLEEVKMLHTEKMVLEGTLAPLKKLTVKDIMNDDPLSIKASDPIEVAVQQFAEHHKVNPIIVVDETKKVVGVLSRHDLIRILALKELGKTVDVALDRQRAVGGAESVVDTAFTGVKKEFLFMPKYKARKWIILGVALFVVGVAVSFLFIVRVQKLAKEPQPSQPVNLGVIKLASLSLLSSPAAVAGQEVSIAVRLDLEQATELSRVIANIAYDPTALRFVRIDDSAAQNNFAASVELLDLKTNSLFFGVQPKTKPTPVGGYELGRIIFVPLRKTKTEIKFNEDNTAVNDSLRNDVLKSATGLTLDIR